MATFNPPTVNDLPGINPDSKGLARKLFRYYGGNPRGRSVVLVNGHWTTMDYPLSESFVQGKDGVDFFLGGHIYTVTSAQAAALTADGYGANLT